MILETIKDNLTKPFKSNVITKVESDALVLSLLRISQSLKKTIFVVLPQLDQVDKVFYQLQIWSDALDLKQNITVLPEISLNNKTTSDNEGERMSALYNILLEKPNFVLSSSIASLSYTPNKQKFMSDIIKLTKGNTISYEDLLKKLVDIDYDDAYETHSEGEYAKRGGIIDVFSPAEKYPVRIEFWGDEIESLRLFNPENQRSIKEIEEYTIIPRVLVDNKDNNKSDIFDWFDDNETIFVNVFNEQTVTQIKNYCSDIHSQRWELITRQYKKTNYFKLCDNAEVLKEKTIIPSPYFSPLIHINNNLADEINYSSSKIIHQLVADQITQWLELDYNLYFAGNTKGACQHIKQWCKKYNITIKNKIIEKDLPNGVFIPKTQTVILTEKDIFAISYKRTPVLKTKKSTELEENYQYSPADYADLENNDYAVHTLYGICIYKGITMIEKEGVKQEVFEMEFADDVKVYIPLWQANLIHRYIGGSKGHPRLNKIDGNSWSNKKNKTIESIKSMAVEMIQIQAIRKYAKGFAFPKDDMKQRIFEEAFPFNDTLDQIKTSKEIKDDMIKRKPMDRLLCGDVGYGKTEVAMRAVFKCVEAGKQVAILVPTTILAQQHLYTFTERFAEYPFKIDMLSRFRTRKEQDIIIENLKKGEVDIVIGTHRLVQKDIKFKDLGLVIIDEEQRFGVKHKEQFKRLRSTVDILTMTATPIPRTMYLSMSGLKNFSSITSPPQKRLAVKSIVSKYDENMIKDAVQKELQRGGQVFYLYNRVKTIQKTVDLIQKLVPDAKVAIGHGQMSEQELENIMGNFIRGNIDVLVCTTIIESGLDIPNANTIIIDRADRFGLAELYQLRGRVGRATRQAYAYFLLPKELILTEDARQRMSAIRRYTQLGTGFKLALRDLEIRGAGNIIGSDQSGYINNVGFDLYCNLLKMTVSQLQNEEYFVLPHIDISLDFINFAEVATKGNLPVAFPEKYIPEERLRLSAYRKLSSFTQIKEINDFQKELQDKYGKLSTPSKNMLQFMKIKILGATSGFESISTNNNIIFLKNGYSYYKVNGTLPQFNKSKNKLSQIYDIISNA